MTKKHIHRIYGIVLSVAAVIAGICLIVACIQINSAGDRPFSAEAVAGAFQGIAIPVYLCVALIVGGFILDIFLPVDQKKNAVPKQYEVMAEKLYKNADAAMLHNPLRQKRVLFGRISLLLLAVGSVLFLMYALNGSNFSVETISSAMAKASVWLGVCMAIPFGFSVFSAYYAKKSFQKEIDLLKDAGATPDRSPSPVSRDYSWLRWAIAGIAIVMIVVGFVSGGTQDVLTKAVNICTECVGLG